MMKIYFDGEFLEFDEEDLDYMYIDEGAEGIVYKYGKDAIKIYKDYCFRSRLTGEECEKLSSFTTKRIQLPEKIVYGEDAKTFIGYSTPFIYTYPSIRIMDMKVSQFVDELDIIRDDLRILAYGGVEIADWHSDNILFDGRHLFIGDPGGMFFRREVREQQSMGNNVFTLNRFLKDEIFPLAKLSKNNKKNIETVFDDFEYMGWQIKDSASENETVRQYVKRMTR